MNLDKDKLILFCSIMDFGKGSKALKLAKKSGALGGAIFLGKGTIKNELLNLLGVLEVRKEIFLTIVDEETEDTFYNEMENKFNLDKPNKGIAFSSPLKSFIDIRETEYSPKTEKEGVNNMNYEAIFVIVNKGLSEDVLDAAESAGSKGGTVIHGRGSGTQEKEKLFNIEIEPKKDIILILSKTEKTENIVKSIKDMLNICQVGAGIVFTLGVNRTLGLYEE